MSQRSDCNHRAVCSATESKFLQATKGFQAGKQVMTDEEYDQLKKELRKKGSKVTAQARSLAQRGKLQSCTAEPVIAVGNGSYVTSPIRWPHSAWVAWAFMW